MEEAIKLQERIWKRLPLLMLGMLAVLGSTPALLLPETNGKPMPQTIEEGEKIVRSYTLRGKAKEEIG